MPFAVYICEVCIKFIFRVRKKISILMHSMHLRFLALGLEMIFFLCCWNTFCPRLDSRLFSSHVLDHSSCTRVLQALYIKSVLLFSEDGLDLAVVFRGVCFEVDLCRDPRIFFIEETAPESGLNICHCVLAF